MWKDIPATLQPIAFSVGPVSIYWYGIFFLLGALSSLFFLKGLFLGKNAVDEWKKEEFFDLVLFVSGGALLGAHLGYIMLYGYPFFASSSFLDFLPIDRNGTWRGISGMSFHGGVVGGVIGIFLFARRRRKDWKIIADSASLSLPIALFFGRVGNFFSGELFGRVTLLPWGMVFPHAGDAALRHPSQLYEAMGEGIVLFGLLSFLSRRVRIPGALFSWAIGLYSILRFFLEFFREPDAHIGFVYGGFTFGQVLCGVSLLFSLGFWMWIRHKKSDILSHAE